MELLVDLVAPDVAQIVVRQIEEHAADHLLRVRNRGERVARAHALVDFAQRVVLVVDARLRVFAQRLDERAVVERDVHDFDFRNAGRGDLRHERRRDGVVGARQNRLRGRVHHVVLHDQKAQIAFRVLARRRQRAEVVVEAHDLLVFAFLRHQRAQQRGRVEFPATAALVHETPHHVVRVEHDLDPVAAVRYDAHGQQRLAVGVDLAFGRDARAAVQLGDDDALGAVHHERAVRRHHRNVAEKHLFFAHVVPVLQAEDRAQGPRIGLAIHQRLQIRLLRRVELIAHEIERIASVIGGDGEDFLENRLQACVRAGGWRRIQL